MATPWLRKYVAGLSTRRPGFDPRSAHVRIVVGRVAEEQVLFRGLRFSSVHITAPTFHIHLHVDAAFSRREKGCSQGYFQKATLLRKLSSIGGKNAVIDLSTLQRLNTAKGGNHNLRSIQG